MNKKNQQTSGDAKKASARQWADEVIAIEENSGQGGIEIRFNAEPSPELQPKLRVMGFRHSRSMNMWYGDKTPEAMEFAEKVKAILPTSSQGPDLFLAPSFDAVKSNIEKKEFSYILITLKDGQAKNFIVFESSKPRAEVIAMNFAKQEFEDQFLALAAKPKTHIREARILFDEGKIIGANEFFTKQKTIPVEKKIPAESATQNKKIPLREVLLTTKENNLQPRYKEGKDPLTNDSGVYTEKTAGENYEKISVPMPKGAKYEAEIRIVKTSNGDYRKGISCSKQFGDAHGSSYAPAEDGEKFPARKDAFISALKEIQQQLQQDINQKDAILNNEENKNNFLNIALKALQEFADENNVSLDTQPSARENIKLKEIQLITDSVNKDSKPVIVNSWKEADDLFINKKWEKDTAVQLKVIWKDGETFEQNLTDSNFKIYENSPNPLSDFVYQYNLAISQTKPLEGSYLRKDDISKAKKIVDGYSFSDKKISDKEGQVNIEEIIPVPGIEIDFSHVSAAGGRNYISEETHKKIGTLLRKAKTDLFYYKNAAWTLVKGLAVAMLELPEMTDKAKAYYEDVYKTTFPHLKKDVQPAGIIKGLEAAYWNEETDGEYPANKAIVLGMEFQQARLRELLKDKQQKLSIYTLSEITNELAYRFKERRSLDTYEKGLVTIGKTGDKRKKAIIASYVDDMIIDNDLFGKNGFPVMTFLVKLLFDDSQMMVDFPMADKNEKENKKPSLTAMENDGKQEKNKKPSLTAEKQSQHELNQEIEAFINKKDKEGSAFNAEEKMYIQQYTGSGGLLKEGATGRGVLYEYYTPDVVVQKMWGMAFKYGYDGGSVLEPAIGTGNFLKYAPKEAAVVGFETNHYSARIAQVLYPAAHIHEKAFESLFFTGNIHLKDDFDHTLYSLVIGNPPYGEFTGRYAGMGEKKWTGATEYDQYFILRGLDLLKKGGLLVFIVPSSFLDYNIKSAKVKEKIAAKADLLDAYRLPIRTFSTTDIGTDIILFKRK